MSPSCFQGWFTEWSNPESSCSSLCPGKLCSQVSSLLVASLHQLFVTDQKLSCVLTTTSLEEKLRSVSLSFSWLSPVLIYFFYLLDLIPHRDSEVMTSPCLFPRCQGESRDLWSIWKHLPHPERLPQDDVEPAAYCFAILPTPSLSLFLFYFLFF